MSASTVVVGANQGLSPAAEQALTGRGILVVPGFVAGSGGSASMDALFGPDRPPSAHEVLDDVAVMMRELVGDVLAAARDRQLTPRQVALDIAAAATPQRDGRPYGSSPYRPRVRPSQQRWAHAPATATRGGSRSWA